MAELPLDTALDLLASETALLAVTAGALTDAQARAPSRLPGWSRGHVLSHLARNAEGGTRLLHGARTGAPGYEYESVTARAAAIDGGADWPAAFTAAWLPVVAQSLTERGLAPLAAGLEAADTGRSVPFGGPVPGAARIRGTEAALLAWLTGRSAGEDLDAPGRLPAVPSVYHT